MVLQELQTIAAELGLLAIAVLTALYLFYSRILVLLAWLLHASFAVGLALASTSVLAGPLYQSVAVSAVENTGIPQQLREGDAFVHRMQSMPERILQRVRHPFGVPEPELVPFLPSPPGRLETSVLPLLHGFARGCLRLVAFAIGMGLMCFGLASRSRVDLVLAERALRNRVEELESKLAAVEFP